jgi:hypothetical protein
MELKSGKRDEVDRKEVKQKLSSFYSFGWRRK